MTTTDKANDSAQRATGKASEAVDEATDDDKLQADDYAEMERNLKQAGFKK